MSTATSSPLAPHPAPLIPHPAPLIKTLAWKDYREQRAIWLAIAILAVILPFIIPILARGGLAHVHDDMGVVQIIYGCLMALIVGQGIVCGAQLFAGETDGGSLVFLDALSSRRLPIWRTKLLVGALFTLLQTVVVISVSIYLTPRWVDAANFAWLAIVGWLALLWGTVGGVICQRVFPAILLGIALLLANFALLIVIPLVRELVQIALAVVPLVLSYRIFCAADIQRFRAPGNVDMAPRRAPHGLLTMLWLAHRQGRWIVWPGLAVSFIVGYFLQGNLDLLWPLGTLIIGGICGLASFAPEQTSEQERFLGAQRFPPGRIWSVKTSFWALATAGMASLYFTAVYYRQVLSANRTDPRIFLGLFSPDGNLTLFTVEWLIYGFACGQFAALLARRVLVSTFLAVVITVFLLIWWLPSLVFGGIQAWQILAVPVLLLITARLTMWIWLTGRLYTRRHWLLLAACGLAIGLWIGANLWYRVVEIPDVGEPFDLQAFNAKLTNAAQSEATAFWRRGSIAMEARLKAVHDDLGLPTKPLFPLNAKREARRFNGIYGDYLSACNEILAKGWPPEDEEINRWLDAVFAGAWAEDFRRAASMPPGLLVDPRTIQWADTESFGHTQSKVFERIKTYAPAGDLFAVHSMQSMSRGDDQRALADIKMLLALSRQLRFCLPVGFGLEWPSRWVDRVTFRAVDFYVQKIGGNSQSLHQALRMLQDRENEELDPVDSIKAYYMVIQNNPSASWHYWNGALNQAIDAPIPIQLALDAPWEAERQSRLIRALYQGIVRYAESVPAKPNSSYSLGNGLTLTDSTWTAEQWRHLMKSRSKFLQLPWFNEHNTQAYRRDLRIRELQIAAMLYQIDMGHSPRKLDDLVPRYLAKVPLDPARDEPFNYKVSTGEAVKGDFSRIWGSANTLRLQPGQGVLWIGEAEERTWYPVPMVASEKK